MNESKLYADDVIAICYSEKIEEEKELTFHEILMDETKIGTEVFVKSAIMSCVGGINSRLKAKQNYELLLRMSEKGRIINSNIYPDNSKDEWVFLAVEELKDIFSGLITDCYLIARYCESLLSLSCFDEAVLGIIQCAQEIGKKSDIEVFMEKMLRKTKEFYYIYDGTQPILIFSGSSICYNVLSQFAVNLGSALKKQMQNVEYFDTTQKSYSEISIYTDRRFKAIVGFHSYFFTMRMKNNEPTCDYLIGPKYHFLFDHPIRFFDCLSNASRHMHVMTLDMNYVRFIETYYGVKARFFPPAGIATEYKVTERIYGLSFIGSYEMVKQKAELKERLKHLYELDRETKFIINRTLLNIRANINDTLEDAYRQSLRYYGYEDIDPYFLKLLYHMRWISYYIASSYRHKVMESLLLNGIVVHVFGETWKECPLRNYQNLICHDEVVGEESLKVWRQSKLSLNVMAWHKDGFTERIANIMLQNTVVVSDKSVYLEKNFENEKDLVLFDLNNLNALPVMVKKLLADDKIRKEIAKRGYEKALKYHTWDCRAEEFIKIMDEDAREENIYNDIIMKKTRLVDIKNK